MTPKLQRKKKKMKPNLQSQEKKVKPSFQSQEKKVKPKLRNQEKKAKASFQNQRKIVKRRINDFEFLKINLASPQRIRQWSERILPNGEIVGEVKNSETINYRTFRP